MNKKIILLTILTVAGLLGMNQMVYADNSTLFVLPASLNSPVGAPFNVSVQLNPVSNKVCVVKGALVINNLTCQSITVANGVMVQVAPTCAAPNFTLGIAKCVTTTQNLFSVSVKGTQAGQGSIALTDIKVIGVGANVAFSLQGGVYNISAIEIVAPKTTPTSTPAPAIVPTPPVATSTITPAPTLEIPTIISPEEEDKVVAVQPEEQKTKEGVSLLASIGSIATFGTGKVGVGIFTVIVIIAIIAYLIYSSIQKKRKNSVKK